MEKAAAKELYFEEIKLLPHQLLPRPYGKILAQAGVYIGFSNIDQKPGGGRHFCGGLAPREAEKGAQSVSRALAKIPTKTMRKLRLRYVILCSSASRGGMEMGGTAIPPLDLLALSIKDRDEYTRKTTMHEFYHFLEYRLYGLNDPEWDRLFGHLQYTGFSVKSTTPGTGRKGFINAYSETLPSEDRAEIFGLLMSNPLILANHIARHNDHLLNEKVIYMIGHIKKLIDLDIPLPDRIKIRDKPRGIQSGRE